MSIDSQSLKKGNKKTGFLISVVLFLLLTSVIFMGYDVYNANAGCSGACFDVAGGWGTAVDAGSDVYHERCKCSTTTCGNVSCSLRSGAPTNCSTVAANTCQGSSGSCENSDCTSNTVAGTKCCTSCSYITSYNTWDACHYDGTLGTYIQRGTNANVTSQCSGCPGDASSVRTCGVCNGAVPASSIAPLALTPCLGGSVAAMNLVSPNWTWNCLGGSGGSAALGCSSSYVPVPTVSLTANPVAVNLNGGTSTITPENVNLNWNITNSATACPGGCTCNASGAWAGTKTFPNAETAVISSGADPTYTLTCNNTTNGVGSNSKTVVSSCTPIDYYDACNVTCGNGTRACHHIDSNCNISSCGSIGCSLPACPVTSEWTEVKP